MSHQVPWKRLTIHCYVQTANCFTMATRSRLMLWWSRLLGSLLSQVWANSSSLNTLHIIRLTNRIRIYQQRVVETLIFCSFIVCLCTIFYDKKSLYLYWYLSMCLFFSEVIRFSSWVQEDHCKQMSTLVAQSRILFMKSQSLTLSIIDVVLSPTVPLVDFLTIKNWYTAHVKF